MACWEVDTAKWRLGRGERRIRKETGRGECAHNPEPELFPVGQRFSLWGTSECFRNGLPSGGPPVFYLESEKASQFGARKKKDVMIYGNENIWV